MAAEKNLSSKPSQSFFHLARICLAIVIALAFTLPGFNPAQAAATRTVNTLADSSGGKCNGGTCSLRDAINLSADGDTIQFSVTGTIILTSPLAFSKSLTIRGPGAEKLTLDGNNQVQVINSYGDSTKTVSISGLTIANGSSGGAYGGGIRNYNIMGGPRLIVDHVIFRSNASSQGAAIFSQGPLTVTNSLFDVNVSGSGGAIKVSFYDAEISQSTFTNNQATSNDAGALYLLGISNPVTVNLSHCTFIGNTAARDGGAIRFDSYVNATITDSIFDNNAVDYESFNSQGSGGAIYSAGSLAINRSAFIANQAGTASTSNNQAGAIYTSGTLNITNSTFYNNKVRGAGGAIAYDDSGGTITNASFYGNTLIGPGSGRAIYGGGDRLTVVNTLIASPEANANCGDKVNAASNHNLANDSSCGASFSTVTLAQLNLAWQGWYLLPLAGSSAIDAGTNTGCPAQDQRGWSRPVDGDGMGGAVCDVGAVEATPLFVQVFFPLTLR